MPQVFKIRLILNAADHKRTAARIFDRGAHMVESRVVDSDESVVKVAGGPDFESDVTDLLFEGRQLQKKIRLEVLRRCQDLGF